MNAQSRRDERGSAVYRKTDAQACQRSLPPPPHQLTEGRALRFVSPAGLRPRLEIRLGFHLHLRWRQARHQLVIPGQLHLITGRDPSQDFSPMLGHGFDAGSSYSNDAPASRKSQRLEAAPCGCLSRQHSSRTRTAKRTIMSVAKAPFEKLVRVQQRIHKSSVSVNKY